MSKMSYEEDVNTQREHYMPEEEQECRVCRGEAEQGRPLLKPCKCSGSIGLTHQDCLQSWLEVQRGDGRCELCKTKFRFAPQYAENAPERLPTLQIILGLNRRIIARWLPFLFRSAFAASLWLVVAPLVTCYLYQAWMYRPTAITERFNWELLPGDIVSGAVIVACIIVSFLALMSFADFLRVEWQHPGGFRRDRFRFEREVVGQPRDEDIDDTIYNFAVETIMTLPSKARAVAIQQRQYGVALDETQTDSLMIDTDNDQNDAAETNRNEEDHLLAVENESQSEYLNVDSEVDDDFSDSDESWETESDDDDNNADDDHDENMFAGRANGLQQRPQVQRNAARMDEFPDLDQDEAVEMDINIALDELLGVRGPLITVFRNLLWLLAFNTVYLGFFVFTPRVIGTAVYTMYNSTFPQGDFSDTTYSAQNVSDHLTIRNVLSAVELESERTKTTFHLPDLLVVVSGYLACALAVILFQFVWSLFTKPRTHRTDRGQRPGHLNDEHMQDAIEEINQIFHDAQNGVRRIHDQRNVGDEGIALIVAMDVAFDAMVAVVKVGVLLFLKMFCLPIFLGLCLDVAIMPLLGIGLEARIRYAGVDLFSFLLLHWVIGITFMLLVTVSVLQLREVFHPDLLAHVIRPQEPQPDLLGNLMKETITTHAKRMVLSLFIYAVLLTLHVYIPVKIAVQTGLVRKLPFLQLKFSYVLMPELQIPVELLVFHLCMLALLERYKNGIGEMQHHWLKVVSGFLGLSDCTIPKKVDKFRLLGSRPVFKNDHLDMIWSNLSSKEDDIERENIIVTHITGFVPPVAEVFDNGEIKASGERILRFGLEYIRVPLKINGRTSRRNRSALLPTKIGRYRLKRDITNNANPSIQLWEEVHGDPIPRPPEGWDDLGAGGADVQGRWAWEMEKKSHVEKGVAKRCQFFPLQQGFSESCLVVTKLFCMVAFAWFTTTILLAGVLLSPLAIGRLLYFVLQIPDHWIHDPLAFALGSLVFFPMSRQVARSLIGVDDSILHRIYVWFKAFRRPPTKKLLLLVYTALLWFGVIPIMVGSIYDIAFIKEVAWFNSVGILIDFHSIARVWATGSVLLAFWSHLCTLGVLSKQFWSFLFERPADGQANEQPEEHEANLEAAAWMNGNRGLRLTWQGKYGRMARFWSCWKAAILCWEWEKVDHVVLLHDCALPVVVQLTWTLVWPVLCLFLSTFRSQTAMVSPSILVRAILAASCSVQTGRVWIDQLKAWFESAHKTARDDRYLIGEVLLNFEE